MCARQIPFQGYPTQVSIGEAVLALKRPSIPDYTPPDLAQLIRACWDDNVAVRPTATKLKLLLSRPGVVPTARADEIVPMHTKG